MKQNDIIRIMLNNGLSEKQALLYATLLLVKISTASSLSIRTGISRSTIYLILNELVRMQLVEESESFDTTRFRVSNIRRFTETRETALKEQLEHLRELEQIQNFIDDEITEQDLNKSFSQLLVGYFDQKIKSLGVSVFKVNREERTVQPVAISSNRLADFVIKNTGFYTLKSSYPAKEHFISRSVAERSTFVDDEVSKFITPAVSKEMAEKIQWLGKIKSLASIPILQNGKVIGVVLISFREEKSFIQSRVDKIEKELQGFAPILKILTEAI